METINRFFASLKQEEGQAMTEYALVLTLLAAGVVAAVGALTGDLTTWIEGLTSSITSLPGS